MKRKKWFDALGEADERYVDEADPTRLKKAKGLPWRKLSVIAACFLVAFTALGVYLFTPITIKAPNVSMYAESDYYGVIQGLNAYAHKNAQSNIRYKNNFEKLLSSASSLLFGCTGVDKNDMAGGAPEASDRVENYEEITDNQTAGIIEGDRIKRTDEHIFYLDLNYLWVYTIAGEETQKVGHFDLGTVPELYQIRFAAEWEMYLSADGETVTLVGVCYSSERSQRMTVVLALDVSDVTRITVKNKTFLSGDYVSSRILESGELLLITRFLASQSNFEDVSNFVPYAVENGETRYIGADAIVCPDVITSPYYTVLSRFDGESFTSLDSLAFLSYAEDVYVSDAHVYTMRTFTDIESRDGYIPHITKTEITAVTYKDAALSVKGTIRVDGSVKDRYSLDEYEDVLRVVTTTNSYATLEREDGGRNDSSVSAFITRSNANLYLYDMEGLTRLAEVIAFAPDGETVRSVRFDKQYAYVCTSIELKDPVFFFDLSDPAHITYKDTGTIDGYSTSLVSLGNGFLLGIGYGDWDTLKCEIYHESETGVISVDAFTLESVIFSEDYKSYYIDRQNGLIGIGVETYGYGQEPYGDGYIVLHFDGYSLEEIAYLRVNGEEELKRGCYIDGFFYAFGGSSFAVRQLFP